VHVASLELTDFRSYESLAITLSPGINILTGKNGQGKTNLLEAVGLLSVAKSARGATDTEMVRWGADGAALAAGLVDADADMLQMELRPSGNKRVAIDGAPLATVSELVGVLRTVQIAPEAIDRLFRSASGRRRMLDILIAQIDRAYLKALIGHRNTVAQLNALLKKKGTSTDELAVWEHQVAARAVDVVRRRHAVAADLSAALGTYFGALFGESSIEVRLSSTLPVDDTDGALEACVEALAAARPQSRRRGFVSKGAHRDRVDVLLRDREIERHASQGQVKGAYLAWKMAEGDVIEGATGTRPVWLVDDPFSEMDRTRALRAFEMLADRGQVLLTTARDDDLGMEEWDCARWRVESGTIERL
jgi:DNA replication and repair protein RecF